MKKIDDLRKELNVESDEEFEYRYAPFKNDYRVKTSIEAIFGIEVKRAYVSYPEHKIVPKKNKLDWDSKNIILVLKNGNIIYMDNSEWAGFELIKK